MGKYIDRVLFIISGGLLTQFKFKINQLDYNMLKVGDVE